MKRLLDDDEPRPNKRNPRDVEITRLLPEHISEIASYSLEALVRMAQSQTWWLEEIQKNRGKLIAEHAEWHPLMRKVVKARFAEVETASPALELPLVDDIMVPWPLIVQNWVRWNEWLRAKPDGSEEAKNWTTEFELYDYRLLARAGTEKGAAFMKALFNDALAMLDSMAIADDWIDGGPILSYLALLEVALRVYWKGRGDSVPAVSLIVLLSNERGDAFLRSFRRHLNDARSEALLKSLRETLPHFFLTSKASDAFLSLIYDCRNANEYATLSYELRLPNPLGVAVGLKKDVTPLMCERLGRVGAVLLREQAPPTRAARIMRDYVGWVAARGLFNYPWTSYWAMINPELSKLTQEQLV